MKIVAALLLFCICGVVNAGTTVDVAGYRALVEQDLRLATVGYRLTTANGPYCSRSSYNAGWVMHDINQYPDKQAARGAFGFAQPVQISAIVPDGEASKAGFITGDAIVRIGEMDVASLPTKNAAAHSRISLIKQKMSGDWGPKYLVSVTISRSGKLEKILFRLDPVCASDFWVDTRNKIDAGADGDQVRVTTGLMLFASDDDELAAAVAHELAHNILGHRDRLKAKGGTRAVLATEIEADRLSVWLMANAGYDPKAALRFAERYGRKTGLGIFSEGTHLRWKNRVRVIQAEIDLMAATAKQNGLLPPPLLTGGR